MCVFVEIEDSIVYLRLDLNFSYSLSHAFNFVDIRKEFFARDVKSDHQCSPIEDSIAFVKLDVGIKKCVS